MLLQEIQRVWERSEVFGAWNRRSFPGGAQCRARGAVAAQKQPCWWRSAKGDPRKEAGGEHGVVGTSRGRHVAEKGLLSWATTAPIQMERRWLDSATRGHW